MENEKFVLFLDILGFRDLIENNTLEEIKKIYENQVIQTIGPALQLASLVYGFPISLKFAVDGTVLKDTIQEIFEIHIMSDSIIIWTKDTENITLMKLLGFTSVFIQKTFILGVPLRGAISKGNVSELTTPVNNILQSCVIGNGIVNAYKLEGKQNWMGCIVDPICFRGMPMGYVELLISKKNSSVVKYKVPIKKRNIKGKIIGDFESNYVINWTNVPGLIQNDIKFFEDNFSRFEKSITNKDTKYKIKNTFNFYQIFKKK